jgi:transcriptional regulator with XRE-family HTH domain
MSPRPATAVKGNKLVETLRQKIREAGLTLREVEERLGLGKDYLRHVLSGRVDLKLKHVLAILAVLGLDPGPFFAEVYGSPTALAGPPRDTLQPQLGDSQVRTRSGAAWFLARKLWEHGILTDEEIEAFATRFNAIGPTF